MNTKLVENYFKKELAVVHCQSEKFTVWYHKSLFKAQQYFSLMTVKESASLLNFQKLWNSRSASISEKKDKISKNKIDLL